MAGSGAVLGNGFGHSIRKIGSLSGGGILLLAMALGGCAPRSAPVSSAVAPLSSPKEFSKEQREAAFRALAAARQARGQAKLGISYARDSRDPSVRAFALRTLGLIGDPSAREVMQFRLQDESPTVRAEAAFSLSLLWGWDFVAETEKIAAEPLVEQALFDALIGEKEPRVREAMVRALAWVGGEEAREACLLELAVPGVLEAEEAPSSVIAAAEGLGIIGYRKALSGWSVAMRDRLIPLLGARDPRLSAAVASAFVRLPPLPALSPAEKEPLVQALSTLVGDSTRPVSSRATAARALGTVGGESASAALLPLLRNPALEIRLATVRALSRLPGEETVDALLRASTEPGQHRDIKTEISSALAAFAPPASPSSPPASPPPTTAAPNPAVAAAAFLAVQTLLQDPDPDVRGGAAYAAGRLHAASPPGTPLPSLSDPDPWVRGQAASGMAGISGEASLSALLAAWEMEKDPSVRLSLLDALGQRPEEAVEGLLLQVLGGKDPALAAIAAQGLASRKEPSVTAALQTAYTAFSDAPGAEVRVVVVDSLSSHEKVPPAFWSEAAKDPDPVVRAHVLAAARSHGAVIPQVDPPLVPVADAQAGLTPPLRARVKTGRGEIVFALDEEQAPVAVANFVTLARSGYFNGVVFHRHVPGFVIQGGDPRGNGTGGPGYSIRCDYNPVPYQEGTVGMALSGKDTGGSQWFITLARHPHLDSHYTAFGQVVEGMEVARALRRGDVMETVTIEADPGRAP